MGKMQALIPRHQVYPADCLADIVFRVRSKKLRLALAKQACRVELKYVREDWRRSDADVVLIQPWEEVAATVSPEQVSCRVFLRGEGEHVFLLNFVFADHTQEEITVLYSLLPDLFKLRPFKGNLHSHSTNSDGVDSPDTVVVKSMQAGFDFMALTEHRRYTPANPFFHRFGIECLAGEEVHSPVRSILHLLSLGGRESVSQWQADHPEEYQRLSLAASKHYPHLPLPERQLAGEAEVLIDKIHAAGGLAVHAHPYWKTYLRYNLMPELNEAILARQQFDALELGNREVYRTALMNARLTELAGDGFRSPLIGASDYHGRAQDCLAGTYSIVLAPRLSQRELCKAILKDRSVAVAGRRESVPFGPFRLVKYALFLMEYYFPRHDRDFRKQAATLQKYLAGDHALEKALLRQARQIQDSRQQFFAGP